MEQWLQKLAGNEEKLLIRSPASNWLEDQLKSGDTVGFFKLSEWGSSGARGLDRKKVDSESFLLRGDVGLKMQCCLIILIALTTKEPSTGQCYSSSYDCRTKSSAARPT